MVRMETFRSVRTDDEREGMALGKDTLSKQVKATRAKYTSEDLEFKHSPNPNQVRRHGVLLEVIFSHIHLLS
jgi:hypothetical protein